MKPLYVLAFVACGAAIVRAIPACLDTTPLIVENEAASASDNECVRCLEAPTGCADLIAQCRSDPANPQCGPIYDCMVVRTCLDLPSLDEKIRCGLPCAQEAGVESTDDPIITQYLLGLVLCAQDKCLQPCNLTEGGVGF